MAKRQLRSVCVAVCEDRIDVIFNRIVDGVEQRREYRRTSDTCVRNDEGQAREKAWCHIINSMRPYRVAVGYMTFIHYRPQ